MIERGVGRAVLDDLSMKGGRKWDVYCVVVGL